MRLVLPASPMPHVLVTRCYKTEIPRERGVEFPLRASIYNLLASTYFGFHAGVSWKRSSHRPTRTR